MEYFSPYTWILTAGTVAAVGVFELQSHRYGRSVLSNPWTLIAVICGAVIGGRVHFVVEGVFRSEVPLRQVGHALVSLQGGSTFYGAAGGFALAAWGLRRHLSLPSLSSFLDAAVPAVAIAILTGRVGCIVNGCCLGRHLDSAWGEWLASHVTGWPPRHPLPLYIGLWALGSAWLSMLLTPTRKSPAAGERFLLFALLFTFGRFWIESYRMDPLGKPMWIPVARWESAILFGGLLVVFLRRRVKSVPREGKDAVPDLLSRSRLR